MICDFPVIRDHVTVAVDVGRAKRNGHVHPERVVNDIIDGPGQCEWKSWKNNTMGSRAASYSITVTKPD